MSAQFFIARLGAQDNSPTYDTILTKETLRDICQRLTGQFEYNVVWQEERNLGKMIKLSTGNIDYYITITPKGIISARNSYLQSVPTALCRYVDEVKLNPIKQSRFCFYVLPYGGNNQTNYHKFIYRLMKTIGVNFINIDTGLNNLRIEPFSSVREIIRYRNDNRNCNSSNNSTYITDEGEHYHIYGKTFGANQKETVLLCLAISRLSEKPVDLFQIIDNDANSISEKDKKLILYFSGLWSKNFSIYKDFCAFNEDESLEEQDKLQSLRKPRFIYNLLKNTNGVKKCCLCNCNIESIVQGAHIYPVAAIKKREDLTQEQKLSIATDCNNGIWLCENHHKLFDRGLINMAKQYVRVSKLLTEEDLEYVKYITKNIKLSNNIFTKQMQEYFRMRSIVEGDVSSDWYDIKDGDSCPILE